MAGRKKLVSHIFNVAICLFLLKGSRGLSPGAVKDLTAPLLSPDAITDFERLPVGNTNQVFRARTASGKLYLVRAFGTIDALAFDRPQENEIYRSLASAGHAPPLIATLPGDAGRIEAWVEGRACSAQECREPLVYEQVAQSLAQLHTYDGIGGGVGRGGGGAPAASPLEETWAFATCRQWLANAEKTLSAPQELEIHDAWLGNSAGSTEKRAILKRAKALQVSIRGVRSQLQTFSDLVGEVPLPTCYCHNDLSPSNVHFNCEKGTVQIIDFEFGGHNFRAFGEFGVIWGAFRIAE